MNEIEATDDCWNGFTEGLEPYKPTTEEFWHKAILESRKRRIIRLTIYIFFVVSSILSATGILMDSLATLFVALFFGIIATLLAFIEWI
ncbi:hypothetical protein LCGC14_0479840 [marine sediment metagenome]|uniref:Uncharacterized protein n=1 Tax=marine sediment metagenome TaxID=412755 RepID=A0A0F9VIJ8_9ZZZZ